MAAEGVPARRIQELSGAWSQEYAPRSVSSRFNLLKSLLRLQRYHENGAIPQAGSMRLQKIALGEYLKHVD